MKLDNPLKEKEAQSSEKTGELSNLSKEAGTSNIDIEKAKALLEQIPAGLPYSDWMRVAAALKNEGVPQEIFMEWSQTSPDKFDENAAKKTWVSVGKEYAEEITFGTLMHLAEKYSGNKQRNEPTFIQPPCFGSVQDAAKLGKSGKR